MLPYECGIIPTEEAKGRYPVRFATIAMLFIIFDVEVVFMYPWAVALGELRIFGLVEMAYFHNHSRNRIRLYLGTRRFGMGLIDQTRSML